MYKPFVAVAVLVYFGLGVGHVIRAMTSSEIMVAGLTLPAWSSWPAAGLAILVACLLWWELNR